MDLGINTDEPRRPTRRPSASSSGLPWWAWAIVVFAGLTMTCCFWGVLFAPKNATHFVQTGQKARLSGDSSRTYLVAADYASQERLEKAERANDDMGRLELIASDRAFMLTGGTLVLVLETHLETAEARVMEGKHAGQTAIVMRSWLFPE